MGPTTRLVAAAVRSGERTVLCVLDTVPVPPDLRGEDDDVFDTRSYDWAPEGDVAIFLFRGEIFTLDAESGSVQRWTTSNVSESNVTFSPNGRWISFTRNNDLWAIDREDGAERALTTTVNEPPTAVVAQRRTRLCIHGGTLHAG